MTGRELVFSNPLVIRMATEEFIPVAEDVSALQQSNDEKGRFFRQVAVQGHMKGRSKPGVSHQGIYAFAADGTSMASGNPLQADKTLAMLQESLHQWALYQKDAGADSGAGLRPKDAPVNGYPEDGVVLRMSARDLPRPRNAPVVPGAERYANQWNFDHVWLQPADVHALVPESLHVGAERRVDRDLVARIARFHLRDIVRGEPWIWKPDSVKTADLTVRVAARRDNLVDLEFSGSLLLQEHVAFRDAHKPIDWEFDNELDGVIMGGAVWDAASGTFAGFDMLVAGQRSGAHKYNARTQDPGPAPIGFAFELAGNESWERTPPHVIRTWSRSGDTPPVATTVTGEPYYSQSAR